MNNLDIIVLCIIAVCVISAFFRGLIISVFNLTSWIASLALANYLYPYVSKILRTTSLYTSLEATITETFGFNALHAITLKEQNDLINGTLLPSFVKKALLENNNPEIYKILNVTKVEDYVSGYIANLCMNILSMVVIFIVVFLVMKLLAISLNIVAKLPVINTINHIGGAVVGFINATVIIWIGFVAVTFLIRDGRYAEFVKMLDASVVAKWFYDTNMILKFILKVVA